MCKARQNQLAEEVAGTACLKPMDKRQHGESFTGPQGRLVSLNSATRPGMRHERPSWYIPSFADWWSSLWMFCTGLQKPPRLAIFQLVM